jgi:hypothetical protein
MHHLIYILHIESQNERVTDGDQGRFKHWATRWLGGGGRFYVFGNWFWFRTYRQKTDNESKV